MPIPGLRLAQKLSGDNLTGQEQTLDPDGGHVSAPPLSCFELVNASFLHPPNWGGVMVPE